MIDFVTAFKMTYKIILDCDSFSFISFINSHFYVTPKFDRLICLKLAQLSTVLIVVGSVELF